MRKRAWILAALCSAVVAMVAVPAFAGDDEEPCNGTIVTDTGSMTAQELCEMIEDSGKTVNVFHSQCYGGDVAECCNNHPKGGGCHNSGGSPGELQTYGEYDQGVADALEPGASAGDIHQSGADNTSSSTPVSGGCGGTVSDGDTVITFAGDPNQQDHDMGQQISDQNDNTVNLEGDGSGEGVEDAANEETLADAIEDASGTVWIWISDHGNSGGPSVAKSCAGGEICVADLLLSESVLDDMAADPGDTAWVFMTSDSRFPETLDVDFNGDHYTVYREDAPPRTIGDRSYYRHLLAVPEDTVSTRNTLMVTSETDFSFEAFVDSGPIEKIGGVPIEPKPIDVEPNPGNTKPHKP